MDWLGTSGCDCLCLSVAQTAEVQLSGTAGMSEWRTQPDKPSLLYSLSDFSMSINLCLTYSPVPLDGIDTFIYIICLIAVLLDPAPVPSCKMSVSFIQQINFSLKVPLVISKRLCALVVLFKSVVLSYCSKRGEGEN